MSRTAVEAWWGRRALALASLPALLTHWSVSATPLAHAQAPRSPAAAAAPRALAFTGGTVIDVTDGTLHPGQTVVVVGQRIKAVGPQGRVRLPKGATLVDARGKYLLPGFWDMELILDGAPEPLMKLLIATGVTGFRTTIQVGGGTAGRTTIDSMLVWRREVAAGRWAGPRNLISGPAIEGGCPGDVGNHRQTTEGTAEFSLCAVTPARGRYLVDSLQAAGADHIQLYNANGAPLRRDVVFAILAEGRRRHIPVVGHLPDSVSLAEASDSGMHAVDHMGDRTGMSLCFRWSSDNSGPAGPPTVDSAAVERCRQLAARFRRNGTWMAVGPLYVNHLPSRLTEAEIRRRAQFYPRRLRPEGELADSALVSRVRDLRQSTSQMPGDCFVVAERAGLPMLLASDKGAAPMMTAVGFQLHDDLAIAVEHGLSPLAALQAVTLNAAQYLGGSDSLGTVEAGKLADLVLLDGNPLADIYNTQAIRAVVADGRYFDRSALDALLQQAGAAP